MSDVGRQAPEDVLRIRKDRIHTTMLIELLVLLVFLAMAFAFVTKDEASASRLQAEVTRLRLDLRQAQKTVRELKAENRALVDLNEQLRASLARWMDRPKDSIPADDTPIVIPKSQLKELTDRLGNAEAMLDERQKGNADLRRQLAIARGGGVDLPNCTVTTGFLLKVDLLGDGRFRTTPAWQAGAAVTVNGVPGVAALASGRNLDSAEFSRLAQQISAWGKDQATPCGFRAQVTERHTNLDLYKRQVRTVERYFYVRRN